VGFLDRAADEYFDNPELDLDPVVELTVGTLFGLIEAAGSTVAPSRSATGA
jgi:hypothetical protein